MAEGKDQVENLNQKYKKVIDDAPVDFDALDPEARGSAEMDEQMNSIYVYWCCDQEKVNSETMDIIQTNAGLLKVRRAIMVINQQTNIAKNIEKGIVMTIEKFGLDDLQVNITQHNMVPKHSVLNFQDKAELLDKYRIKENQLPKIQQTDPIAKYFGV